MWFGRYEAARHRDAGTQTDAMDPEAEGRHKPIVPWDPPDRSFCSSLDVHGDEEPTWQAYHDGEVEGGIPDGYYDDALPPVIEMVDVLPQQVYITDSGERYHVSQTCRALRRSGAIRVRSLYRFCRDSSEGHDKLERTEKISSALH